MRRVIAKERRNNHEHQSRRQKMESPDLRSTGKIRSGIELQSIDKIKKKYNRGDSEHQGKSLQGGSRSSKDSSRKKTKKKTKGTKSTPFETGAGPPPTGTEASMRPQQEQGQTKTKTEPASNDAQLSSSTSSTDEDLARYEYNTAMELRHSANGGDHDGNGGVQVPSPAEQARDGTIGPRSLQQLQQDTDDVQNSLKSLGLEVTTEQVLSEAAMSGEEAVTINSSTTTHGGKPQQRRGQRADSI